jgi:hypothetical protein
MSFEQCWQLGTHGLQKGIEPVSAILNDLSTCQYNPRRVAA